MGLTVGGVFGVAVAVYIVKSMSISTLQWMVIVVFYTSVNMFRRALKKVDKKEAVYGNNLETN